MSMLPVNQSEINAVAWRACDTFRGVVDPAEYKNYILVFLFFKYLSDVWKDKREQYEQEYGGDQERVQRRLSRERFIRLKAATSPLSLPSVMRRISARLSISPG